MAKIYEFIMSEEGEVHLYTYIDEKTFLKEVNQRVKDGEKTHYIDYKPEGSDGTYDIGNRFERGHLIIKGEVVTPKPKKVVTEYEL